MVAVPSPTASTASAIVPKPRPLSAMTKGPRCCAVAGAARAATEASRRSVRMPGVCARIGKYRVKTPNASDGRSAQRLDDPGEVEGGAVAGYERLVQFGGAGAHRGVGVHACR